MRSALLGARQAKLTPDINLIFLLARGAVRSKRGRKSIGGYHISANPAIDGKSGGDVWILFQRNGGLCGECAPSWWVLFNCDQM